MIDPSVAFVLHSGHCQWLNASLKPRCREQWPDQTAGSSTLAIASWPTQSWGLYFDLGDDAASVGAIFAAQSWRGLIFTSRQFGLIHPFSGAGPVGTCGTRKALGDPARRNHRAAPAARCRPRTDQSVRPVHATRMLIRSCCAGVPSSTLRTSLRPSIWRWSCSSGRSERANLLLVVPAKPSFADVASERSGFGSPTCGSIRCAATSAKALAGRVKLRGPDGAVPCGATTATTTPHLASIRNEPEFKAVFADIERDMAQQRARLAARPKDAPLDLAGKQ